jgi:hypothetical protein
MEQSLVNSYDLIVQPGKQRPKRLTIQVGRCDVVAWRAVALAAN